MGGAHQAKTREDEKGHQVEVTNNDNNKITEQGRVQTIPGRAMDDI